MRRKSKIIDKLKEEEIQHFKKMSPQQKIDLAIAHNKFIRSIFGLGLREKGFSKEEINLLWIKREP